MNKTLIALAITATLPVAAVADVTISGTLTSKYKNTGAIDTDSRLSVASSEVLANGMTATAGFSITADTDDDTENSGTATLSGDFGTLTVGSIDADGAFQAGDVGGAVPDTTDSTSSTASTVYGVHFSGTVAGLTVAAQLNANTGATGGSAAAVAATANSASSNYAAAVASTVKTKSTQMSATYEVNGLSLGYAYASADAKDGNTTTHNGVHEGQSAVGASYAMGDLVVSVGKQNLKDTATSPDALVSATYTMTADAITIVAQADNSPSGDYQLNLTYAFSDNMTISSEVDKGKTTTMVGTYTEGDMTFTVARQDDDTTDASIALDYGNADLTIGRVGARAASHADIGRAAAAEYSHVTYKVAF
ncbi:porin [Oceanospirillaceae bacterium]|nr:porin [Oceanospirillaceae bacterium]